MNNIIEESLSAFNDQYRISQIIAEICYDMSLKQQHKNLINFEDEFKNCVIKQIDINLIYDKYTNYFAQFINLNDSGTVKIDVYFPYADTLNGDKEKVIRKIKNCVAHELMHGNIFLNRLNNKKELNDFYIDYEKWAEVRQNEDDSTLLYKFAYAIYATYYQEVQSFVSQATTSFESLYNKNSLTNKEIRDGLRYCEPYRIYSSILNELVPILNEMVNNNETQYLITPLKERYGISIDDEFLKHSIKKFKNVSEKALRNIMRNLMLISNGVGETLEEIKRVILMKY